MRPRGDAPAVGEGGDEEQAAAGLAFGGRMSGLGEAVAPGVGDLDPEGVGDDVEREPEIAAGDAAVGDGVGGQLRNDLARTVPGQPPGAELLCGEQTGEAGSARRGGQLKCEVADGSAVFDGFLVHVTSVAVGAYREQ